MKSRASEAWRISLDKVKNEKRAIVLYKGVVLAEYEIISSRGIPEKDNRIGFELREITNSKFKGLRINYYKSNPCTVVKSLYVNVD